VEHRRSHHSLTECNQLTDLSKFWMGWLSAMEVSNELKPHRRWSTGALWKGSPLESMLRVRVRVRARARARERVMFTCREQIVRSTAQTQLNN
jgi:hypothetical protein